MNGKTIEIIWNFPKNFFGKFPKNKSEWLLPFLENFSQAFSKSFSKFGKSPLNLTILGHFYLKNFMENLK